MARALGLIALLFALAFPAMAAAVLPVQSDGGSYQGYYTTAAQALSACQAARAAAQAGGSCAAYQSSATATDGYYIVFVSNTAGTSTSWKSFYFPLSSYVPPGSVCSARPSLSSSWDGNGTTMEWGGCKYKLREDVAARKVCIGYGTNLGKACTGSATWDPTGEATDPAPPQAAPPVPPAPKVCGVGVCYDDGKKQYCEASGGACVDAETPAHQPSSGCISSGSTTLCVGAPPPLPSNPPINDPPTQIKSSDQFQQSSGLPNVPTITPVTVNNYNTTNTAPQNGAAAGDKGPGASDDPDAPPKDDTGDKTSASGGQNCNTPPICEGAAATCMVVTQTWLLRCKGDDAGASNDSDTTVPGLDGIGEGPGEGFHRTETLLDKLDTGGLGGGGQCPNLLALDLDQYGIHLDGNNSTWCSILDKAGWMLMFIAAFISLRILSEK